MAGPGEFRRPAGGSGRARREGWRASRAKRGGGSRGGGSRRVGSRRGGSRSGGSSRATRWGRVVRGRVESASETLMRLVRGRAERIQRGNDAKGNLGNRQDGEASHFCDHNPLWKCSRLGGSFTGSSDEEKRERSDKPDPVRPRCRERGDHFSGTDLAAGLERPTRIALGGGHTGGRCRPRLSLFGLSPGGVCPATAVTRGAVRSYRTVSPLPTSRGRRRFVFCGTFPGLATGCR